MKRVLIRCWLSVGAAYLATSAPAQACPPATTVTTGACHVTTSAAFVPTLIHPFTAVPTIAAVPTIVPQATAHAGGNAVLVVPQAVVVPHAVPVQQLVVPQVLQSQVVRQRVRTTNVPVRGLRGLFVR